MLWCDPLSNIALPMKPTNFLPLAAKQLEVSIALKDLPTPQPETEVVKIHVIGSLRGINRIILSLHRLGFAEANEWCKPQPTDNLGEYVSVLIRHLLFERKG